MLPRVLLRSIWLAAVTVLALTSAAHSQAKVVTYDGAWGDAIADAITLTPDITVTIDRYDGSLSSPALRDAALVDVETGAANLLCDEGPGQPIAPGLLESLPDGLMAQATHPCGVGYLVTSLVLATGSDGPASWTGFFDAARYPGARALPRAARGTLEIALLADGVARNEVYAALATPEGVDRALAALDQLFAQTQIVFWDTPDDAVSLLRAGAVSAAALPSVHAAELVRADAPQGGSAFSLSFTSQIYSVQNIVVLPAAVSDEEAVSAALGALVSAQGQALLASTLLAGPVNRDAWANIPPEIAALLPTAPAHDIDGQGLADDVDFWAREGDDIERALAVWLAAHETAHSPGPL